MDPHRTDKMYMPSQDSILQPKRMLQSRSIFLRTRQKKYFLVALCALFYCIILAWKRNGIEDSIDISTYQPYNEIPMKISNLKKEKYFSIRWAKHIRNHPIQPQDRIGFAEMGLRCRIYARLIRNPTLGSFEELEKSLWPFVRRIRWLRQRTLKKGGGLSRYLDEKTEIKSKDAAIWNKRGIVMSLGRNDIRFAVHFLANLRHTHKSSLPVEIYYYGEEDLPPFMRNFLEKRFAFVRCIDLEATAIFDPTVAQLSRQGWALKPFVMLATSFTEVILVDADAVFLTDPSNLFRIQGYKETGTLFFHDRDHHREGASTIVADFLTEQLGRRGPSQRLQKSNFWTKKGIYEQESGVVVANKAIPEVFIALLFSAWQNIGGIREQTTYRVFWGEKESYWLAFELAGFPYYFVEHYAGGLGTLQEVNGEMSKIRSEHPLHFIRYDHSAYEEKKTNNVSDNSVSSLASLGEPAWINGGLLEAKHESEERYLDVMNWGMLGDWQFDEILETWTLHTNVTGTLHHVGLNNLLSDLIDTAKKADDEIKALISDAI